MKSNVIRILPLFLAGVLQFMPFLRTVLPTVLAGATPSAWNLIFRLGSGAVALLGGTHAVSGASSVSLTPSAATVGTAFTGVLQYSGSHSADVKSWQLVTNWLGKQTVCGTSYQIAPGLFLNNSANKLVTITGTPTEAGTFKFTMKIWNAANCSGQESDIRTATITITGNNSAPVFSTVPTNRTVQAGGGVSFTGTATGTPTPTYAWKLNSGTLPGATANTLSLSNVETNQAGTYTLSASNSVAVVSVSAGLTVVLPPTNQVVASGGAVSFSAAAYSPAAVSYRWRFGGADVAGGTGPTLNLSNVQAGAAGTYSVIMSNAFTLTTNVATLTVLSPPTLTAQPANRILQAGETLTLGGAASGPGLTYQWLFNSNVLAGFASETLSIGGATVDRSGLYALRVTSSGGTVTSTNARVLVVPAPSPANSPVIQWPSTGAGTISGSWATSPGYRYVLQFKRNLGSPIWETVTNVPPAFESSVVRFDTRSAEPVGFYRVLVLGPSAAGP
jgi:hypothetical protein